MMLYESLNPYSKKFLKFGKSDAKISRNFIDNAVGKGENDSPNIGDMSPDNYGYFGAHSAHIAFSQFFSDKANRIAKYREMSAFPEIAMALDMICDEAIAKNTKNDSFSFEINKTSDMKRSDIREITKEFDFIVNDILNFNEMGWDLFNKWLIDGEMFLEVVVDKSGKNMIGVKPLSPYTMAPIFEGGIIIGYKQIDEDDTISFERNQIVYANFGKYGRNKQDIRGYLDPVIKVYNQLKNLEDAVVIYRLVRAPERRVWNVEVGQAPTGKAEEIVRQTMNRYKRNLNYDPATGSIDSSQNVQALTEDFWFARRDGAGSTVDILAGGQQLGELEDVNFFLRKMYKSLKIPPTRWGEPLGQSGTQYTNTGEIEREELNFTKFIERLQIKFKKVVEDLFILNLRIKGYDLSLLNRKRYTINMLMNNHFRHYREMQLIKEKLDIMGQYKELIMDKHNPSGTLSKEFFMKFIVDLPGNLAAQNDELVDIERQRIIDSGGFVEEEASY
jgi:hypothetical protein